MSTNFFVLNRNQPLKYIVHKPFPFAWRRLICCTNFGDNQEQDIPKQIQIVWKKRWRLSGKQKLYVVEQSSENVNFAEEKQKNSLL